MSDRMTKYARVEEIKRALQSEKLPEKLLPLYSEALDICEELGLERAWQIFKREKEWMLQKALQEKLSAN